MQKTKQGGTMIVILNNIRSSENVGSIFRTADAAGVSKIYLVGYTPAPTDKFGRKNTRLSKAALGAEEFVKWDKLKSLKSASLKVKKKGYKIIGVEQAKNSIYYRKIKTSRLSTPVSGLALVFGNEVEGLSKKELELCDLIAEIPMKGKKESLNVAVSAGIILFSLI
jgi:23S rRNA (guanosine2251-2'-O)-methyltransferase